jgi:hypothetical protein
MKARPTSRLTKIARGKDSFWGVVEDCLIAFHQLAPADAHSRSEDLRRTLDHPPPDLANSLYLHGEPFHMACDMAGKELDLAQHWGQYNLILRRHNW